MISAWLVSGTCGGASKVSYCCTSDIGDATMGGLLVVGGGVTGVVGAVVFVVVATFVAGAGATVVALVACVGVVAGVVVGVGGAS